jgi:hypothetical protein
MSTLDIKRLLGLADAPDRDEDIELIASLVSSQLKIRLGVTTDVPPELDYIVTEVSVIRFNRLSSEGMTAEQKEGYSASFSSGNLFADYAADIQNYLDQTAATPDERKLRFI